MRRRADRWRWGKAAIASACRSRTGSWICWSVKRKWRGAARDSKRRRCRPGVMRDCTTNTFCRPMAAATSISCAAADWLVPPEHLQNFLFGHGPADQITLYLLTAERAQQVALRLRFNSLGNGIQSERLCHGNNRRSDRRIVLIFGNGADEGAVDFQ